MTQEGFVTDANTALLFFRFCMRYKITSREDRITVMREITKRKKAKYIRDIEPFLIGKKVLKIENNENINE